MGKMWTLIDEAGHRYGRLVVLEYATRGARWLCQCDCGNQVIVTGSELRSGNTRSCGCILKGRKAINEAGNRYGRLVVLKRAGIADGALWLCQCDCGNQHVATGSNLRTGNVKSCGCLNLDPDLRGNYGPPPYDSRFTKKFRERVKVRDLFRCQVCGLLNNVEVHHIDYNRHNTTMENCITLCRSCHVTAHSGQEYWYEYFTGVGFEYIG